MADDSIQVEGGEAANLMDIACVAAGSGMRAKVSVDGDLPARDLVGVLGRAVGVAVVGDLMLPDGTPIDPGRSLRAAGALAGSTVFVAGIDEDRSSRGGVLRDQLAPPTTAGRLPAPPVPEHRSRRPLLVAGVIGAAVIGFAAGALVFHGSGSPPPAAGPDPVAIAAARSWVGATPFTGPIRGGIGPSLGRRGAMAATAEAVGWSTAGKRRTTVFVVSRPGSAPFGLTVVTMSGALSFPPTVSGLPVTSGRSLPAVGTAALHPTAAADLAAATRWAVGRFGAEGDLTRLLDLGQLQPAVSGGSATTRFGTVVRITETLSSAAPGTSAASAQAAAAAAASKARAAVATANQQQAAANAAVAAAAAHLAGDQAAAAANPPTAPSAAAAAALPADTASVQSAQQAAAAATTALQNAVKAAALPVPLTPAADTATASYDLLVVGGSVIGSAPSGWEG